MTRIYIKYIDGEEGQYIPEPDFSESPHWVAVRHAFASPGLARRHIIPLTSIHHLEVIEACE